MTRNPTLRPQRSYVEHLPTKAAMLRLVTCFAAGYILGTLLTKLIA